MLIDDLHEQLTAVEPNITTIKIFWGKSGLEQRFQDLTAQTSQENFWQHPQQAEILKELQRIRVQRDQYLHVTQTYADLNELVNLFAHDESELIKIAHEIKQLAKTIASFKIALLLNDPQDGANCFLNINGRRCHGLFDKIDVGHGTQKSLLTSNFIDAVGVSSAFKSSI